MNTLKERILASVENHGKTDIIGIYQLYPQEKKTDIVRSLITLKHEGWIILKKTRTKNGLMIRTPNVRRSKKQYYTQPNLFDPAEG